MILLVIQKDQMGMYIYVPIVHTQKNEFLRKIHVELEPIETNVTHIFTLIFTWGVNRLRENGLKYFCCIQICGKQ